MAHETDLPSDIAGLVTPTPLSRRVFMTATAASAAGYTLAAGDVRAEVVTTSTDGLEAGMTKVTVTGADMPAYFARPAGVKNPPVVLVAMEVFGLHEYIRDVTRRLAKLGALAIAPDLYFRSGEDLPKITDMARIMAIVNPKPDAELLADLDACVTWAKAQGGDTTRLGMIGFCRGGRAVWVYSAHSAGLKAGVAFYGSLVDKPEQKPGWPKSPIELAAEVQAPVLGLYGAEDQGIPLAQVETMKAALTAAGKPCEIKVFAGAPHGFHADYRPSYRKEAADEA